MIMQTLKSFVPTEKSQLEESGSTLLFNERNAIFLMLLRQLWRSLHLIINFNYKQEEPIFNSVFLKSWFSERLTSIKIQPRACGVNKIVYADNVSQLINFITNVHHTGAFFTISLIVLLTVLGVFVLQVRASLKNSSLYAWSWIIRS